MVVFLLVLATICMLIIYNHEGWALIMAILCILAALPA